MSFLEVASDAGGRLDDKPETQCRLLFLLMCLVVKDWKMFLCSTNLFFLARNSFGYFFAFLNSQFPNLLGLIVSLLCEQHERPEKVLKAESSRKEVSAQLKESCGPFS